MLNLLQGRELVLGWLSPKTASLSLGPHCLPSCCFSCDTLSFPLCRNTYNFEALIRQNKKQQQQKRDKKATTERNLLLKILLLLPLKMKAIITVSPSQPRLSSPFNQFPFLLFSGIKNIFYHFQFTKHIKKPFESCVTEITSKSCNKCCENIQYTKAQLRL